jgi:hypothetical protein
MSVIREFEVFLTETACCFRYCVSVVSVVLLVRLDSFGRAWHLSCVLFWLVYILLMLFSGVLVLFWLVYVLLMLFSGVLKGAESGICLVCCCSR